MFFSTLRIKLYNDLFVVNYMVGKFTLLYNFKTYFKPNYTVNLKCRDLHYAPYLLKLNKIIYTYIFFETSIHIEYKQNK